jgi:hypothetical protein
MINLILRDIYKILFAINKNRYGEIWYFCLIPLAVLIWSNLILLKRTEKETNLTMPIITLIHRRSKPSFSIMDSK